MKKTLLPIGFHDVLFPQAAHRAQICQALMATFGQHGYEQLDPPVMEFETSLLQGIGKALTNDTFRLLDPLSHKMLGIRADMTSQIARIATNRLLEEATPLRLSYAGKVFRLDTNETNPVRQITQAGIELIGAAQATADAEVIMVAADALNAIGIKDLSIDFTLPQLPELLLTSCTETAESRQELQQAFRKKDSAVVEKALGKKAAQIVPLMTPGITIQQLAKVALPKEAAPMIKQLEQVVTTLKQHKPDLNITIDPLESFDIGYHSSLGFSIFCQKIKKELARGGRYTIDHKNKKQQAVGITLYADTLFNIVPEAEQPKKIYIFSDTQNAEELRQQGWATIQSLTASTDSQEHARKQQCQAYYHKNKVVNLG